MVEWLKTSQTFLFGSSLRIITGPPFELKIYQCILNRNILQISCQSNFPSKNSNLGFQCDPRMSWWGSFWGFRSVLWLSPTLTFTPLSFPIWQKGRLRQQTIPTFLADYFLFSLLSTVKIKFRKKHNRFCCFVVLSFFSLPFSTLVWHSFS